MDYSNLDNGLINEYLNYYRKYYGAEYRDEQGLNEILDIVLRYSKEGTWLDLGGGTSSFIWLPAFSSIKKAYVIDKFEESFYIQKIVRDESPSGCYRHILEYCGKNNEDLKHIPSVFIKADLLGEIALELKCDNVTQFGLLGLCSSKEKYYNQLDQFTLLMNSDAVFIGANWVFTKSYSMRRKLDNTYIKQGLIKEWSELRGRILLEEKMVPINNDENYESVLVYAFI